MVRKIFLALLVSFLAGCAAPRALVRDCQSAGPGLMNCEKVKDL